MRTLNAATTAHPPPGGSIRYPAGKRKLKAAKTDFFSAVFKNPFKVQVWKSIFAFFNGTSFLFLICCCCFFIYINEIIEPVCPDWHLGLWHNALFIFTSRWLQSWILGCRQQQQHNLYKNTSSFICKWKTPSKMMVCLYKKVRQRFIFPFVRGETCCLIKEKEPDIRNSWIFTHT